MKVDEYIHIIKIKQQTNDGGMVTGHPVRDAKFGSNEGPTSYLHAVRYATNNAKCSCIPTHVV